MTHRGSHRGLNERTLRACAAALLFVLAGCASAPQSQTAAADPKKNGDGIGGTGISYAQNNPRGDGIGGTGVRGTITGFGSILVNGLKLEFDHTTTVEVDGKPTTLEALRVGQIVQGFARTKDGKLNLARVEIQHAVAGPIGAIDYTAETLTVMGQKIRLNLAGDKAAVAAFKTLQAGDIVSVSGLRQSDGTIVATRVDQQSGDDRIMLRGLATSVTATSVHVGDIDIPLQPGAPAPKVGERMVASGRLLNGTFVPDVVSSGTALGFGSEVSDVSLEAYAPPGAGNAGTLNIDGVNVSGAALPPGTAANDRIVVTGAISGPNAVRAKNISGVRTVVTINAAQGSVRPAAIRPDRARPERVAPRPSFDRPQGRPDTPSTTRPPIERPGGVPMV